MDRQAWSDTELFIFMMRRLVRWDVLNEYILRGTLYQKWAKKDLESAIFWSLYLVIFMDWCIHKAYAYVIPHNPNPLYTKFRSSFSFFSILILWCGVLGRENYGYRVVQLQCLAGVARSTACLCNTWDCATSRSLFTLHFVQSFAQELFIRTRIKPEFTLRICAH